jgi:uncharacterized protein YutD
MAASLSRFSDVMESCDCFLYQNGQEIVKGFWILARGPGQALDWKRILSKIDFILGIVGLECSLAGFFKRKDAKTAKKER